MVIQVSSIDWQYHDDPVYGCCACEYPGRAAEARGRYIQMLLIPAAIRSYWKKPNKSVDTHEKNADTNERCGCPNFPLRASN